MSSRNRITVAASVSKRVGGKFCRSKSCAIFMVSTITRSELMRQNARRTLTFWVRADSLVVDPLDFNVYAITRGETRVEDWAKSDHTAIKADGCRLDPRLWNPKSAPVPAYLTRSSQSLAAIILPSPKTEGRKAAFHLRMATA